MPSQADETIDRTDPARELERWEELATNAVGEVIEFWGFKHNHGRMWALLYLRTQPMSASDLQQALDLSKGAVSMTLSDLERWGVVRRTRVRGSNARHYQAELDFWRMISRVFRERELDFVERVHEDLADAARLAALSDVDLKTLARLRRMTRLADIFSNVLSMFLETLRIDVTALASVLAPAPESTPDGR